MSPLIKAALEVSAILSSIPPVQRAPRSVFSSIRAALINLITRR